MGERIPSRLPAEQEAPRRARSQNPEVLTCRAESKSWFLKGLSHPGALVDKVFKTDLYLYH